MITPLLREITACFPRNFVVELLRSVDWAYGQAYSEAFSNPLYDPSEADWLYPYIRRGILEKKLRTIAAAEGMECQCKANDVGNHQFTQINAGRFVVTCSHQTGELWRMLRSSDFREQNAKLNALLPQLEFKSGGFEVWSPEDDGGKLNAVIYHGTDYHDKSKARYVRIGIPTTNNRKWDTTFDFYELLEAYPQPIEQEGVEEAEKLIIKWKHKSREEEK